MQKILSFVLTFEQQQVVKMPFAADIIEVSDLGIWPRLYAVANPDNTLEDRVFEMYRTGDEVPNARLKKYIGSFTARSFKFHVFENPAPGVHLLNEPKS